MNTRPITSSLEVSAPARLNGNPEMNGAAKTLSRRDGRSYKDRFGVTLILAALLIVTLTACGGDATPIPATPAPTRPVSAGPVVLPTPTPRPLVQPKVVRSVNDPRGLIEFTDLPDLADGWPTLIWFDAERSTFTAKMSPIIASLKERYKSKMKFAQLDYYDPKTLPISQRFRITDQPAFVVVDKTGQFVKSWNGLVSADDLETYLKKVTTP